MEESINQYKEAILEAKDFRDLDELSRKILIQRFIDQVIYDADKFNIAIKLLKKWEKNNL